MTKKKRTRDGHESFDTMNEMLHWIVAVDQERYTWMILTKKIHTYIERMTERYLKTLSNSKRITRSGAEETQSVTGRWQKPFRIIADWAPCVTVSNSIPKLSGCVHRIHQNHPTNRSSKDTFLLRIKFPALIYKRIRMIVHDATVRYGYATLPRINIDWGPDVYCLQYYVGPLSSLKCGNPTCQRYMLQALFSKQKILYPMLQYHVVNYIMLEIV